MVLGTLVGGPGTTTIGCLGGAQVDRHGNINSTLIPDGPFLVGSGGGNDVASVAAEVGRRRHADARSARRPSAATSRRRGVRCGRSSPTSAGSRSPTPDGELVLTAVPAGDRSRSRTGSSAARAACGWALAVAATPSTELPPPTPGEIAALRGWDPRGWFLRG